VTVGEVGLSAEQICLTAEQKDLSAGDYGGAMADVA